MQNVNTLRVRQLTYLSVLTALVIVLQLFASAIPVGMCNLSFVLVPIVIGAAFCGPLAGAWLGLVFAVVVLLQPGTALFYGFSVAGTIVTVLVKGVAAGFLSGLVYRTLRHKNKVAAVFLAALTCPVVNTGLFVLGCYTFMYRPLTDYAAAAGMSGATALIFLGFVGINFFVEVGINLVLAPGILRLIHIREPEN